MYVGLLQVILCPSKLHDRDICGCKGCCILKQDVFGWNQCGIENMVNYLNMVLAIFIDREQSKTIVGLSNLIYIRKSGILVEEVSFRFNKLQRIYMTSQLAILRVFN